MRAYQVTPTVSLTHSFELLDQRQYGIPHYIRLLPQPLHVQLVNIAAGLDAVRGLSWNDIVLRLSLYSPKGEVSPADHESRQHMTHLLTLPRLGHNE